MEGKSQYGPGNRRDTMMMMQLEHASSFTRLAVFAALNWHFDIAISS